MYGFQWSRQLIASACPLSPLLLLAFCLCLEEEGSARPSPAHLSKQDAPGTHQLTVLASRTQLHVLMHPNPQIARTCAIFSVAEIVVYMDASAAPQATHKPRGKYRDTSAPDAKEDEDPATFLARVLEYLETPQCVPHFYAPPSLLSNLTMPIPLSDISASHFSLCTLLFDSPVFSLLSTALTISDATTIRRSARVSSWRMLPPTTAHTSEEKILTSSWLMLGAGTRLRRAAGRTRPLILA